MLGTIIGDIIGSVYEFSNIKTKEFPLFSKESQFTDDTVMTLAIAKAILNCHNDYTDLSNEVVKEMRLFGSLYPNCSYGGRFSNWLVSNNPVPYNSFGNGAAMRISLVAYVAGSLREVKLLSRLVTEVTHNHEEGIKGAEATAVAIYLARNGVSRSHIKQFINDNYYNLDFTLAEIRPTYEFDETCQNTVPQSIVAFLESNDFEDAIRNAISIGGDSDTVACITGSIAESYYGVPDAIMKKAINYLDDEFLEILIEFHNNFSVNWIGD